MHDLPTYSNLEVDMYLFLLLQMTIHQVESGNDSDLQVL